MHALRSERNRRNVVTDVNNSDAWRENVRVKHRRITLRHQRKIFFMPGDACAQVQNLSPYMACAAVSETRDGTPDMLEAEADWDTSNDEREQQAAICTLNLHNLVGLVLGPARGLTDAGATAACGGSFSCSIVL